MEHDQSYEEYQNERCGAEDEGRANLQAEGEAEQGIMECEPHIIGRIGNDDGCECQRCGKKFLVDIMVSDHSFAEISDGKNLLCGHCIITSLESNGFGAFDLVDVDIISRLIPALTNVCQIFDGWHQDGTVWSTFDEECRQEISKILGRIYEHRSVR